MSTLQQALTSHFLLSNRKWRIIKRKTQGGENFFWVFNRIGPLSGRKRRDEYFWISFYLSTRSSNAAMTAIATQASACGAGNFVHLFSTIICFRLFVN